MAVKKQQDKVQAYKIVDNIFKKNRYFYENLSDEDKKAFTPFTLIRWIYGSVQDIQVVILNETLNKYMFLLPKHPDLLYKLSVQIGNNRSIRAQYQPAIRYKNDTKNVEVIAEYYNVSTRVAKTYLVNTSIEDIKQMKQYLGYQDV